MTLYRIPAGMRGYKLLKKRHYFTSFGVHLLLKESGDYRNETQPVIFHLGSVGLFVERATLVENGPRERISVEALGLLIGEDTIYFSAYHVKEVVDELDLSP